MQFSFHIDFKMSLHLYKNVNFSQRSTYIIEFNVWNGMCIFNKNKDQGCVLLPYCSWRKCGTRRYYSLLGQPLFLKFSCLQFSFMFLNFFPFPSLLKYSQCKIYIYLKYEIDVLIPIYGEIAQLSWPTISLPTVVAIYKHIYAVRVLSYSLKKI